MTLNNLRHRSAIGFVSILAGSMCVLALHLSFVACPSAERTACSHVRDRVRMLAGLVADDLARGERDRVSRCLSAARSASPELVRRLAYEDGCGDSISVGEPPEGFGVSSAGSSVAEAGAADGSDEVFEIAEPVTIDGVPAGALHAWVSTAGVHERVISLATRAVAGLAAVATVTAAFLVYVDARIRRVVRRLAYATRRIVDGDLDHRVNLRTGDEFEQLGHNFDRMARALAEREADLRRANDALAAAVRDSAQDLSTERGHVAAIVEAVGAGVVLLDTELRVTWANDVAMQWFGRDGPIVGRCCPWQGVRKGCDRPECPGARTLATSSSHVDEAISVEIDGIRRHFTFVASPVCGSDGRVEQVLELIIDVTRQKETEASLIHAAKLASLGELAGGVAHEVGNPLAVVAVTTRLLLDAVRSGGKPENLAGDLLTIDRHVRRIRAITEKLLAFARRSPGVRSRVRIAAVLDDALGLLVHRLDEGIVRVALEMDADLPDVVACRGELAHVFVNLVQNALDAMPGGGDLRITGRLRGGRVEVAVADTGPGMTAAVRARAFEPFFTTKDPGCGTGLGLSIAQRICREHGGDIAIESSPASGTTITVSIPAVVEALRV